MKFALALLLGAASLAAQQSAAVYRVSFSVHESEAGKAVETKNYSLLVQEGMKGVLRLGSKVPVPAAAGSMQYVDVGLNLDCIPRLLEPNQLSLGTVVEMSSVESELSNPPRIRQIRAESRAVIAPGKPVTIASADDLAGKRHYDIEVTAVPVK